MRFLFDFRGCIGRLEWWFLQFISMVIFMAGCVIIVHAFMLDANTSFMELANYQAENAEPNAFVAILGLPLILITAWIGFTASVKRYHDRGKSGFWTLIVFIPFGSIFYIIECGFFAGDGHDNNYSNIGPTTSKNELISSVYNGDNVRPDILARRSAKPQSPAAASKKDIEPTKPKGPGFGRRSVPQFRT